jgi:hypothetical protein
LTDVDDDGIEDLLYADAQWGEIHCYDVVTVTQKWEIDNPEHGVTNLVVKDTDEDGDLEILWGAGHTSTGPDYLFVYCVPTRQAEWQSIDINGPFRAIDVGDVDSDGRQEIVVASSQSESGYSDGIILIYDAETHELEWQGEAGMFGQLAWTGLHDIKIGDVDDDGEVEMTVATDRLRDGAIHVINGITHEVEQSYFYDDGCPMYSIVLTDVDNDGQTEIVAGCGQAYSSRPVYVYVIDGATGAVEWQSNNIEMFGSVIYALEVGDIDDDGVGEIVAANNYVFVFDGISHESWQGTRSGCYGLDLHDMDEDGIDDIIVGTDSGDIVAIDGQTYDEKFHVSASSSQIVGLRAADLNWNGDLHIVFAADALIWVYHVESAGVLWQSNTPGFSAGEYNNLVVSDYDADGIIEMLTGTNYTVNEFHETHLAPVPAIKAKLSGSGGSQLTVKVSLDPGSHGGEPADWWVAATTPYGIYWHTLKSGWVKSNRPVRAYGGPLFDLAPLTILERSDLPAGEYTFHFAVDNNMDNVLDATYVDSVRVQIE